MWVYLGEVYIDPPRVWDGPINCMGGGTIEAGVLVTEY